MKMIVSLLLGASVSFSGAQGNGDSTKSEDEKANKKSSQELILVDTGKKAAEHEKVVKKLTEQAQRVFSAQMAWMQAKGSRDTAGVLRAEQFLLQGVSPTQNDQPAPILVDSGGGGGETTLAFSEQGYIHDFFNTITDELAPLLTGGNGTEAPGSRELPPPRGDPDLARLEEIVKRDQEVYGKSPGGNKVGFMWFKVKQAYELLNKDPTIETSESRDQTKAQAMAGWAEAFGHGPADPNALRAGLGKTKAFVSSVNNPFLARRDKTSFSPFGGRNGLLNQGQSNANDLLNQNDPMAPFRDGLYRASDFKPQLRLKIRTIPSVSINSGVKPKVLAISDGTLDLVQHFGSAQRALWVVIDARGGDAGQTVSLKDRIKARDKINDIVGGLKDPRWIDERGIDYRLKEFDHSLNAFGGVVNLLPPEQDDWWITRKFKTVGRSILAAGVSGITLAYNGVKLLDQNVGTNIGGLVGQDFHDPRASSATFDSIRSPPLKLGPDSGLSPATVSSSRPTAITTPATRTGPPSGRWFSISSALRPSLP